MFISGFHNWFVFTVKLPFLSSTSLTPSHQLPPPPPFLCNFLFPLDRSDDSLLDFIFPWEPRKMTSYSWLQLWVGSGGVLVTSVECTTKAPQLPGFGVPEPLRSEPWVLAMCFPHPGVWSVRERARDQCTQLQGVLCLLCITELGRVYSTAHRAADPAVHHHSFSKGP